MIQLTCTQCQVRFSVFDYRADAKFCSHRCSRAFENQHVRATCGWHHCKVEFTRARSQISASNFCSAAHQMKWLHSMNRVFGGPRPTAFQGPNKLERTVGELLDQLGVPLTFVGDDPNIKVAGVSVDFINEMLGIVVEVFGQNWHTPEDEKSRIELMESHGWACLVIWEREVRGTNWVKPNQRCLKNLRRRVRRWWKKTQRDHAPSNLIPATHEIQVTREQVQAANFKAAMQPVQGDLEDIYPNGF